MNKTALLVNDDPVVRLIIQKMIHYLDSSDYCLQCDNGEEALTVLETLQSSTHTVVVL